MSLCECEKAGLQTVHKHAFINDANVKIMCEGWPLCSQTHIKLSKHVEREIAAICDLIKTLSNTVLWIPVRQVLNRSVLGSL